MLKHIKFLQFSQKQSLTLLLYCRNSFFYFCDTRICVFVVSPPLIPNKNANHFILSIDIFRILRIHHQDLKNEIQFLHFVQNKL